MSYSFGKTAGLGFMQKQVNQQRKLVRQNINMLRGECLSNLRSNKPVEFKKNLDELHNTNNTIYLLF